MATRLADLNQASEASQTSPSPPRGSRPKTKKKYPAFNNPSYKYGNPMSPIVGTSAKRLTITN